MKISWNGLQLNSIVVSLQLMSLCRNIYSSKSHLKILLKGAVDNVFKFSLALISFVTLKAIDNCLGQSYVTPVKTNILPVKTKCSNQSINPLHIAPTAHQVHDAQGWVHASNVYILNYLLVRILLKLLPNSNMSAPASLQIQKKIKKILLKVKGSVVL